MDMSKHPKPIVDDEEPLISEAKELASEYRKRKNVCDVKGMHPADVPAEEAKGWEIQRPGKARHAA